MVVTNAAAVSRETKERLKLFAELFHKWTRSMNLVAPSTLGDLWSRHIADSLQIYQLNPGKMTWIDLGSGGGFPGVITAICLAAVGDGWVHLVESNHKKAAFLRMALQTCEGRGTVHPIRIETAPDLVQHCDAISARALADLDQLLEMAEPWALRNPAMKCFFHKGREYRSELEISHRRWNLDLVEHRSAVEQDSVILEISGIRRKSDSSVVA